MGIFSFDVKFKIVDFIKNTNDEYKIKLILIWCYFYIFFNLKKK